MTYPRLLWLFAACVLVLVASLTVGLRGNIAFVLELRAVRLVALVEVAVAIAVSTVVFQTVTGNRILTPSIMGLDALYVFGQTLLVFSLGAIGYAAIDPTWKFLGDALVLAVLAGCLLFPVLGLRADLNLMLLAGVVLGVLFRSLSTLLARLIDPNDFAVVQDASFADFNTLRTELTLISGIVIAVATIAVWRLRHALDVMALGRDAAIGLGIDWKRTVAISLALVVALVAVSTALVGPVAFLGLLVVAIAERLVGTQRHAVLLPGAVLVAILVLAGGQMLLQHALGGASSLGIVIEFAGGLVFLLLLLSKVRR